MLPLDLTFQEIKYIYDMLENRAFGCCLDDYPWELLDKFTKIMNEIEDI